MKWRELRSLIPGPSRTDWIYAKAERAVSGKDLIEEARRGSDSPQRTYFARSFHDGGSRFVSKPSPRAGARGGGPDASPAQQITIPKNPTQGFLTIVNPDHVKVSTVEAEKTYLAACEALDRKFARSTQVRPRLALRLDAGQNPLHCPNREIRLVRWDKHGFAEAVVDLALHDLAPPDERLRLSKLAVTEAAGSRESL